MGFKNTQEKLENLFLSKATHEEREAFEVTRITGKDARFPDSEIPQLRPVLTQLAQDTKKLAYRILKALALAMNLPQDYFVDCHQHILGKLLLLLFYLVFSPFFRCITSLTTNLKKTNRHESSDFAFCSSTTRNVGCASDISQSKHHFNTDTNPT